MLGVKQFQWDRTMGNISQESTAVGIDPGKWVGRIIIGVLVGEAIWNLIVSAMNNIVVPWLGDAMGQSSGLPTSFTQRPYNYPDFFVSAWESCIAAMAAAVLNYFFQRRAPAPRSLKTPGQTTPGKPPLRVYQNAASLSVVETASSTSEPTPIATTAPVPTVAMPSPIVVPELTGMPIPVAEELPPVAALPIAKPVPKADSPNPKKRGKIYYNLVGEPLPSDEDSK
jgi:hypothetical protein